ncbi:PilN domain-containing protein [Halofilum ochraceum]|uniref:PilN domain-containing protein n=1 Tax=Halofilum ochraceum TaxID=1611323 RepID=UPI0008DA6874|nr:PilN domain-containing protein [Halofilum ochraceum]
MTQQINLYLDEFRRRTDPLDAKHIGIGIMALLAILAAISAGQVWQVRGVESRVAELERERDSVQAELNQKQQRLQSLQAEQNDDEQLRRLRAELAAKQRLAEYLESGRFGTRGGFSVYLQALARNRVEDLWLARVELRGGGSQLRIAGHALNPETVPSFLSGLAEQPSFSGYRFRTMRIDRTDDGDRLDFLLASDRREGDG